MKAAVWCGMAIAAALAGCGPQPPVEVIQEQPVLSAPAPIYTAPLSEAAELGSETVAILNATGQPAPPGNPVEDPYPAGDPGPVVSPEGATDLVNTTTAPDTILITQESGLVERLPNTCKLQDYQQFQGQSETVLTGAAIDRTWRVVEPDAIITQEYNPGRLNFYTNGAGVIQRITCG